MSIKCTKLFENQEAAAKFAMQHRGDYAKVRRSTEDEKKQLGSARLWAVIWYEKPYQGARLDAYLDRVRTQRSPEATTIADAATVR